MSESNAAVNCIKNSVSGITLTVFVTLSVCMSLSPYCLVYEGNV